MTKADIVETVYEKVGLSKRESVQMVDMIFAIIKDKLENGENVKLSGFGSFTVRDKKSRRGRNPQTGEEITISARRVLSFKPSNVLRMHINES